MLPRFRLVPVASYCRSFGLLLALYHLVSALLQNGFLPIEKLIGIQLASVLFFRKYRRHFNYKRQSWLSHFDDQNSHYDLALVLIKTGNQSRND